MSPPVAQEAGADVAFERLYEEHRGDVYRFVLRDVRNPADAEDVTQAAFLNAYRALKHGDRPEKPRAWLFTIAQNAARHRFRSSAARPREVPLDPDLASAPEQEGPTAAEISEALRRLRPSYRSVLVLREIGGLSYAEVAEHLGISVSAVETLIFRARRALREELASEERRRITVGGVASTRSDSRRAERRRKVMYLDADGRPTEDPSEAVHGEVLEYALHRHPVRRVRFFLSRSELPWLPVSEPAFLLWVLALLFVIWLAIGLFLLM